QRVVGVLTGDAAAVALVERAGVGVRRAGGAGRLLGIGRAGGARARAVLRQIALVRRCAADGRAGGKGAGGGGGGRAGARRGHVASARRGGAADRPGVARGVLAGDAAAVALVERAGVGVRRAGGAGRLLGIGRAGGARARAILRQIALVRGCAADGRAGGK